MDKPYPEMNEKEKREADKQARRHSENETRGIPQPLRKPLLRRKKPSSRGMDRA